MVQNARIHHHVAVVRFLLPLPLELLPGDLPVWHIEKPVDDLLLKHVLTFESLLVHGANQVVVILLVHLETNLNTVEGLNHQSAINDPFLVVDAERELFLGVLDERLAQEVGHVAHVPRPEHVAVVSANRLVQDLLD